MTKKLGNLNRKIKALQELTAVKKRKKELEVTAQKLAESTDKKAKEAENKTCCYNENITDRVKCFKKKMSGDNEDRCSKT